MVLGRLERPQFQDECTVRPQCRRCYAELHAVGHDLPSSACHQLGPFVSIAAMNSEDDGYATRLSELSALRERFEDPCRSAPSRPRANRPTRRPVGRLDGGD